MVRNSLTTQPAASQTEFSNLKFENTNSKHECQNVTADGVACEAVMNAHCDHAMACSTGPLRIKRHYNLADCLVDIIDECGPHVRREAYMKTFSTEQSDAWLDVWASGGLHVPELILDMTVRHPVVARCQPGASH